MPTSCPRPPVWGARSARRLFLLCWAGHATLALATSAGFQGPVELSLREGAPCAHVAFAAPTEARDGWSLALSTRLNHTEPGRVLWSQDTGSLNPAGRPPSTAALCIPLPAQRLQPAQPYRVELSTYRLYRSDFCWRPAPSVGHQPALLAVDADSGRCTDRPWAGEGGHALSPRSWPAAWARWWRALIDRAP